MSLASRHIARRTATQALYQWMITGDKLIVSNEVDFIGSDNLKNADTEYFNRLVSEIPKNIEVLENALQIFIERPIDKLDPVERVIILIGTFEIMFQPEIPTKVIINEAIEVSHIYGAEESYRFVNGVLDKLATERR